ncbi:hypothetical protein BDN67DRAFT_1070425 [Paxillus ammoniavirescens]|nr:hypothetical protein BDN67DRAFT_1070425 [Paxillus ammoniavirescens]
MVSSLSAAQPQPVSSYLASLFFSPQSIRSKPSHISDMKWSQLASLATSQRLMERLRFWTKRISISHTEMTIILLLPDRRT